MLLNSKHATRRRGVRVIGRLAVAAVSGAVLAWAVTALVLDAMFAAGGYTPEAVVRLPAWGFTVIGGCGALLGLAVAALAGRFPLPACVRPVVLGSLIGVAAVVVPTLGIAWSLGGASSKGQAPYLDAGRLYGVPLGLAGGAVVGLIAFRRRGIRSSKG